MHRVAFRSLHTQAKIHWQPWPIFATRATGHQQRQSFESCQRQFHVSSPRKFTLPTIPTELVESIQSLPPSYLAIPLAAVLPHLLRYVIQTRATKNATERFSVGKPLEIVHSAVIKRRIIAISKDTISTKVDQDQLRQIVKRDIDFKTKLNEKYAQPYSTWERQTLIPPALHLAWTTIMVLNLGPGRGAGVSESINMNGLSHLLTDTNIPHILGCLLLAGMLVSYLKDNIFWQSLHSHYVNQMRPWLKSIFGLNTVVKGEKPGTVVPSWYNYFKRDILGASATRDRLGPNRDTVKVRDIFTGGLGAADVENGLVILMLLTIGGPMVWKLSFIQGLYLSIAYFASDARNGAVQRYERRLGEKLHQGRREWVPLNPDFSKNV